MSPGPTSSSAKSKREGDSQLNTPRLTIFSGLRESFLGADGGAWSPKSTLSGVVPPPERSQRYASAAFIDHLNFWLPDRVLVCSCVAVEKKKLERVRRDVDHLKKAKLTVAVKGHWFLAISVTVAAKSAEAQRKRSPEKIERKWRNEGKEEKPEG